MKLIILIPLLFSLSALVNANKIQYRTTLDVVDTAVCTAAAMKSQRINIFEIWSTELNKRYSVIYPKRSKKEIDEYTAERIMDKKHGLERKGYGTKAAFMKFYDLNCKDFEPK